MLRALRLERYALSESGPELRRAVSLVALGGGGEAERLARDGIPQHQPGPANTTTSVKKPSGDKQWGAAVKLVGNAHEQLDFDAGRRAPYALPGAEALVQGFAEARRSRLLPKPDEFARKDAAPAAVDVDEPYMAVVARAAGIATLLDPLAEAFSRRQQGLTDEELALVLYALVGVVLVHGTARLAEHGVPVPGQTEFRAGVIAALDSLVAQSDAAAEQAAASGIDTGAAGSAPASAAAGARFLEQLQHAGPPGELRGAGWSCAGFGIVQ